MKDDQTWLATVLGGILGTAGGLFGAASFAVPELAIPAGFAGGASGLAAFGGGIASSAMENADGMSVPPTPWCYGADFLEFKTSSTNSLRSRII